VAEISPRLFRSRLALRLANQFKDLASRESRSDSVARSLVTLQLDFGKVAVESPYYWAVYYHDGRGAIRARPGHKLVYFRSPDLDPRIPNRRYPVRATDIRRLTKQQFYRFLRNPASGMIVRDSVGPAEGDPFFTRAGRKFRRVAARTGSEQFSAYVRECMGDLMDAQVTVRVRV